MIELEFWHNKYVFLLLFYLYFFITSFYLKWCGSGMVCKICGGQKQDKNLSLGRICRCNNCSALSSAGEKFSKFSTGVPPGHEYSLIYKAGEFLLNYFVSRVVDKLELISSRSPVRNIKKKFHTCKASSINIGRE
jgi:hypothetical protein